MCKLYGTYYPSECYKSNNYIAVELRIIKIFIISQQKGILTMNYIATWFYEESKDDTSYYPQAGKKGSSKLVRSIYMQIQVPFYVSFKHFNPDARYLFFTNAEKLPEYLIKMFETLNVEVVILPYRCKPPKNWYKAWRNQFYLYDIILYMNGILQENDVVLITDADCVCNASLSAFFEEVRNRGAGLYDMYKPADVDVNGITLNQLTEIYEQCYGVKAHHYLTYYGGEFVALTGNSVRKMEQEYQKLWDYNVELFKNGKPKLNEEALFLSVLVKRLGLSNDIANKYMKRIWTNPNFNNVVANDINLAVWHLPYEKKRGLFYLYKMLNKDYQIHDEAEFYKKAAFYVGIPQKSFKKKVMDRLFTLLRKVGL
jgi:hypothetical protein